MHEMAIAQGILDIAIDNAGQHDAKQIKSIRIQVGKMTEVEPEALRFCFGVLAEGTMAAGAQLDIVIKPLIGLCRDCRLEFAIDRYRFLCPSCDSLGVEIISGRELQVEYLEVE